MDYARAAAQAASKGDQEAADYFRSKATEGYQAEAPKATEGMGTGEKFRAGVGQGMVNIGRQAGNILGLRSDEQLQDDAGLDRALLDTGAGRAGSVVGEIAATAPVGGLVAGAGRRAGMGLIRAGMAEGAAQGALTGGPGERLGGAVKGAALGAALPGALAAYKGVARPIRPTSGARQLIDADVRLTPGEMRPTSTMNQWEQALQSSPVFGSGIRNARDASMVDFQRAAAEAAQAPGAAPISRRISDVNDMAGKVQGGFNQGYDQALGGYTALEPRIINQGANTPLHSGAWGAGAVEDAAATQRYPGRLVTPDMRQRIGGAMQEELSALPQTGNVTGRELQGVRSNLRQMARDTDVPGERAILGGGERRFTESIESQLRPEDAALLRQLDAKYPDFKILQDVTKRGGDQPGGWTPAQLSQAVRAQTDLGEYARGGGRMRSLSKAGRKVFEQRSMPTGERQVTTGVLGKMGLPIMSTASYLSTKIPTKALSGRTDFQKAMIDALRKARTKYGSEAQVLEALGTAGLIQGYGE
jgi:hypothetical protein